MKETTIFKNNKAFIISNSHNDIAWLDTPLGTIKFRNDFTITNALNMTKTIPGFKHNMECSLFLRDWTYLNKDLKDDMHKAMKEGKFGWGATYSEPYETSIYGDGLARQFYLGKRWIDKEYPGANIKSIWNQDVPARALQSAQLMQKAGVSYIGISRMKPGFFKWYSPDGSYVSGLSNGHYQQGSLSNVLKLKHDIYENRDWDNSAKQVYDFNGKEELMFNNIKMLDEWYKQKGLPPFLGYFNVRDYDAPTDFTPLNDVLKKNEKYEFPEFEYKSYESFMDEAHQVLDKDEYWDEYRGERPNLWVYHEISHAKPYRDMRRGVRSLIQGEIFSVLNNHLTKKAYPSKEIDSSWEKLLYIDHGWGGYNGHVTDATYSSSLLEGKEEADKIVANAIEAISKEIKVEKQGNYFTVFNSSPNAQKDFIEIIVSWKELESLSFKILDSNKKEVNYQIIDEPKPYHLKVIMETDIPALGYSQYEIVSTNDAVKRAPREIKETKIEQNTSMDMKFENKYFKAHIQEGGLISLIDNEIKQELFKTDMIKGFEIYSLTSVGNGAGEFPNVQHAAPQYGDKYEKYGSFTGYADRASNKGMRWQVKLDEGFCTHNGSVVTIFTGSAKFEHFTLEQEIRFFNNKKKIDVKVNIKAFDGTMFKEIRMAVPLKEQFKNVKYEVPFGISEVGKTEVKGNIGPEREFEKTNFAGAITSTKCEDIHPRELQTWCGSESDDSHVLLSAIDVPAFDWDVPQLLWVKNKILDPILLASRHSCFEGGNPYTNTGDHSYEFTFTSNAGKIGGESLKEMENLSHKLMSTPINYHFENKNGDLPKEFKGISLEGDVKISAIKKAEDSDEVVVRVFEEFGNKTKFKINLFESIVETKKTDLLEYGGDFAKAKELNDEINPYSIETYMLKMK